MSYSLSFNKSALQSQSVSQGGREGVSQSHSLLLVSDPRSRESETQMRLIAEVSASEVLVVLTIKIVEMAKSEVNSLRMSNNFCGFWRFHLNTSRNYLFFCHVFLN